MVSIENLNLRIVEDQGRTTAVVTYDLRGGFTEPGVATRYTEMVELRGDDDRPGEDRLEDFIPGGRKFDVVLLPLSEPRRVHVFNLAPGAVDEDRSASPNAINFLQDEIFARVTINAVVTPITARSNIVTRGGPVLTQLVT